MSAAKTAARPRPQAWITPHEEELLKRYRRLPAGLRRSVEAYTEFHNRLYATFSLAGRRSATMAARRTKASRATRLTRREEDFLARYRRLSEDSRRAVRWWQEMCVRAQAPYPPLPEFVTGKRGTKGEAVPR